MPYIEVMKAILLFKNQNILKLKEVVSKDKIVQQFFV